ncbi:MAG: SDR family oxidoreductase [Gammaproteobacteria bacterium]|nr:SDR family oxidoreductase [Gammaproteobacteria bacterium]MBT5051847.1 SDR family oxidoreductase [Gammaproteobacteria bacterium]
MSDFSEKNIVVTGAASGVGAAVVRRTSELGAQVAGLDINKATGESVVNAQGGQFIHCDVSDVASWHETATTLNDRFGSIDHLHLNAGIQIAPPEAPLGDYQFSAMNLARYKKMTGVNIDGVVYGLYYLLPLMRAGGSIVVTGSLAGITPYDIDPLYAMTKHAVTGLVRSLKVELGARQLRINALCPGGIDTGIIPQDQRTPDAVFMTPESVAHEVMMLFMTPESGATWAKVSEGKPAWIVPGPGQKKRSH